MVLLRIKFTTNEMFSIFDIVHFPFLDDVPRSGFLSVYVSRLIRLLVCSAVLTTLIFVRKI